MVLFANRIMTAPVTDITAVGGLANVFISVRLFCKKTVITTVYK